MSTDLQRSAAPAGRRGWLGAALYLALPVLYLPEWFKVVALDGTDFRPGGNGIPMVLALLLPALAHLSARRVSGGFLRGMAALAALAGAWLYCSVHRSAWDESSARSAWLFAGLGVALCALRAQLPRPRGTALLYAALPLVGAQLLSLSFLHAPILVLALLLAIAADQPPALQRLDRRGWRSQTAPAALFGYLVLAPVFEGGFGDRSWAFGLALAVLGLCIGASRTRSLVSRADLESLALPVLGLSSWALVGTGPHGVSAALVSGAAGLFLGMRWSATLAPPCAAALFLGAGLAYAQSQRSLWGLALIGLCVWSLVTLRPAPRE